MRLEQEALIRRCKKSAPSRIAVAAAGDAFVLQALSEAYRAGISTPILCGDIERIDDAARMHNIDISPFEIIEADNDLQAISMAVSMVRRGNADMLMKGLIQTGDLLRAVLDRENGLRGGGNGVLSHVAVIDCPSLNRTLLLTDGGMVTSPDLKTKAHLINNAVLVAKGLGIELPKVAPLAALELVNPDMQATLDAAALTVMNRRGQITGCLVDGPLALDGALSPKAAQHKQIDSEVAGNADILLFHNIEAANSTVKALTVAGGCLMGGVVMGAAVPIILSSRSDSMESRLYSISVAHAIAAGKQL